MTEVNVTQEMIDAGAKAVPLMAGMHRDIYPAIFKAMHALAPGSQAVESRLPERDTSKPAEQQGAFRKFEVKRVDGSDKPGGKHEGCEYFVLDVNHDPHAQEALYAYATSCRHTHPQLSKDMIDRYDLIPPPPARIASEEDAILFGSLLRKPGALPDGCYCALGRCAAPKPQWCRDPIKRDSKAQGVAG